jgi:hypothetical protein
MGMFVEFKRQVNNDIRPACGLALIEEKVPDKTLSLRKLTNIA